MRGSEKECGREVKERAAETRKREPLREVRRVKCLARKVLSTHARTQMRCHVQGVLENFQNRLKDTMVRFNQIFF